MPNLGMVSMKTEVLESKSFGIKIVLCVSKKREGLPQYDSTPPPPPLFSPIYFKLSAEGVKIQSVL